MNSGNAREPCGGDVVGLVGIPSGTDEADMICREEGGKRIVSDGLNRKSSGGFEEEDELKEEFGSKKSIRWDESTIALHDQERGTRMKIDEPNTPFRRAGSDEASDDECVGRTSSTTTTTTGSCSVCPQELIDRLSQLSSTNSQSRKCDDIMREDFNGHEEDERLRGGGDSRSGGESGGEVASDGKEGGGVVTAAMSEQRRMSFEIKRRAHYNEFQVMKQLRDSGSFPDEDEDDSPDRSSSSARR
eukprot:GHVS01079096.1.p1 GENE.GHVS01079096.1~~GHVS01079096.1.p1  ORF type:complete len:245 (+),score=59.74 GHVS01079096.1:322-1056(+)